MPFTVFYAWQSDRPENVCRYFVRDAAETAVKRVAKEYAVDDAPAFDHATEGELGLIHIADTIKRKIREWGAIIADLTHVAEYATAGDEARPKRATNANVAIEFGYAMHVLNPRQIRPDLALIPAGHDPNDKAGFVGLMKPAIEQFWRGCGQRAAMSFDKETGAYKHPLDEDHYFG